MLSMCGQRLPDVAKELTMFAPELVEASRGIVQSLTLIGTRAKCCGRLPELTTEKLWKILGSFVEEHGLVFGHKPSPSVTDGANHVVGEVCEVLIQEEYEETNIENGLDSVSIEPACTGQGVTGCGDCLSPSSMLRSGS